MAVMVLAGKPCSACQTSIETFVSGHASLPDHSTPAYVLSSDAVMNNTAARKQFHGTAQHRARAHSVTSTRKLYTRPGNPTIRQVEYAGVIGAGSLATCRREHPGRSILSFLHN